MQRKYNLVIAMDQSFYIQDSMSTVEWQIITEQVCQLGILKNKINNFSCNVNIIKMTILTFQDLEMSCYSLRIVAYPH